jgi:LPXTG-motif cell wall-anchored protein
MMKTVKSLAIVFCVGLFLIGSSIKADQWDKKTILTFSGPVQVGKTVLPAGTYVFKLADTMNRNIVQIFNEDESHIFATINALPDYRLEPTGHTVIKFAENEDGSQMNGTLPEGGVPIREWFYPGDEFGQMFRIQAVPQQIAEAAPAPEPEAALAPEAAAPEPAPEPQAEAPAPEPQAPAVTTPETPAPQAEEPAPAPQEQTEPQQLPQTGSQLPLAGLIGVLSLAAFALLRIFLKISA